MFAYQPATNPTCDSTIGAGDWTNCFWVGVAMPFGECGGDKGGAEDGRIGEVRGTACKYKPGKR